MQTFSMMRSGYVQSHTKVIKMLDIFNNLKFVFTGNRFFFFHFEVL